MELYETVNRQQEWEQDQMNEIAKALVKAQKEFGPALKTSTNPYFRSRYADLSACVEAVIDALNNNGIMLTQRLHPSENGVTVETIFLHESGATMSAGMLNVPAGKQDPQGYGSALTYARRYSLMAACGIAPEDDDGNAASKKPSVDVSGHVAAIETAESSEELVELFQAAMKVAGQDQTAQAKIIAAKKARQERAKKEKAQ